jgi:hypothetical protein
MDQKSFFNWLPYDVRAQIYTYLSLLLFSFETTGLALSCRAALQEVHNEAVKPTNDFLADLESRTRENVYNNVSIPRIMQYLP